MNKVTDVADHIEQLWSGSAFMNLLQIRIDEIHCGGATVSMPIVLTSIPITGWAYMAAL